jgi:hypothetical protein
MTSYCIRMGIADSRYTEPRTRRRKAAIGWRAVRAPESGFLPFGDCGVHDDHSFDVRDALTLGIGGVRLDPAGTPSLGWKTVKFRAATPSLRGC